MDCTLDLLSCCLGEAAVAVEPLTDASRLVLDVIFLLMDEIEESGCSVRASKWLLFIFAIALLK